MGLQLSHFEYRHIDACKHIHAVKSYINANNIYLRNEPKPEVLSEDVYSVIQALRLNSCYQYSFFLSLLLAIAYKNCLIVELSDRSHKRNDGCFINNSSRAWYCLTRRTTTKIMIMGTIEVVFIKRSVK